MGGGANGNVKLFSVGLLRIKKNLVSTTKLLPGAITDLNDHNLRHKIEKNWKFQANYKKTLDFLDFLTQKKSSFTQEKKISNHYSA